MSSCCWPGAPRAPPCPESGLPEPPAAPATTHTTKADTFLHEPGATVDGQPLFMASSELEGVPRPAGLTRPVLEADWTRYAEPTGPEQVAFSVWSPSGHLGQTELPDARGVLTLTLPPRGCRARWPSRPTPVTAR